MALVVVILLLLWGCGGNGSPSTGGSPTSSSTSDEGTPPAGIVSAGGAHTSTVLFDGTGRCWGFKLFGQLGDPNYPHSPTPVVVRGIGTP